jgi:hypothetical protein
MTKRSKLGGMSLSDFGKTTAEKVDPLEAAKPESKEEMPQRSPELQPAKKATKRSSRAKKGQELVTINIKITRDQKDWLADMAQLVRDNNDTPVAPGDRVYPQHLIGVAIDLLQSSDLDWGEVRTLEDIKQHLSL